MAINITLKILISIPALAICFIEIYPLEKTTALGGVEMGNINAQLAAMVNGMTNSISFNPNC